MEPRHDQPFPAEVISYCSRRLRALQIEPSRPWLKDVPFHLADAVILSSQIQMVSLARDAIPKSMAIWETSDFYRYAMPLVIFDVSNGPLARFEYFELLYVQMLGDEVRPWLPSLYLAGIAGPNLTPEYRVELLRHFNEDRLLFETEADDRTALRNEDI